MQGGWIYAFDIPNIIYCILITILDLFKNIQFVSCLVGCIGVKLIVHSLPLFALVVCVIKLFNRLGVSA